MLRPLLALVLLLAAPAWVMPAGATPAGAMPEQVAAGGAHQVVIRRTSEGNQALLVANRGQPRRAVLSDQSLEAVQMAPIDGHRALLVRGWSGGMYCCFRLAILIETRAGWHVARRIDVATAGTILPLREHGVLWLPDGMFDFWDLSASLGTSLSPPIAWHLRHGRLEPDDRAMRRPVADALGQGCTSLGQAPHEDRLPHFRDLDQAMRELPQGEWGQMPNGRRSWRPEAEFARRALCLLHMGHGSEATALFRAWPNGQPGRPESEAQLRARLLCGSPAIGALRAMNGASHPWLTGRCGEAERAALTALSDQY